MSEKPEASLPTPAAIVGAGAVGTALARRLTTSGVPVTAILSRDDSGARALADRVGAAVGTNTWSELPKNVRTVLICVPDEAISSVSTALSEVDHPWDETIVAHTSGAHTADALAPLRDLGAATASLHPLQTFTPDTTPEAFEDIVVAIEGDDVAVSAGQSLARTIGARPMRLSARDKVLYHCAATLASNGFVALMGAVQELLNAIDGAESGKDAANPMAPLINETWANLQATSPESALTGPVARNDRETVDAHLDALANEHPHLVSLYAALSCEMARIAERGGQLESGSASKILDALDGARLNSANGEDSMRPLH